MKTLDNQEKRHFRIPLNQALDVDDLAAYFMIFQEYGTRFVELDPDHNYIEVVATDYDLALTLENLFLDEEYEPSDLVI